VCVIAISKSHEFLLKVRRLSSFVFDDDAYAFTSTRRIFSTTTQGIRLDDESMFFHDVGHRAMAKLDLFCGGEGAYADLSR